MNWTDLSEGLTTSLRQILEDAYAKKPPGLLEFVASELEARAGYKPGEFESLFEEAKKAKRTYKLEDECPAGVDPMVWIPRRYDDEAILVFLRAQGRDTAEHAKHGAHTQQGWQQTYPEFAYLRARPELRWLLRYLQAIAQVVREDAPDEEPAQEIVKMLKEHLDDQGQTLDFEEAAAAGILRVLYGLPEFQWEDRPETPFGMFEARPTLFPTIMRMSAPAQGRIKSLTSLCIFEEFLNGELLPATLSKIKDVPNVPSLFCVFVAEYLSGLDVRGEMLTEALTKKVLRALASLQDVGSKTPHIIASQYLEKTAVAAQFAFDKSSLVCRAVVRFALLCELDLKPGGCAKVEAAFQELSAKEKHALQRELCKDGLLQYPAFSLVHAHKLLSVASANPDIPLVSALRLFTGIITEAATEAAGAQGREGANFAVDFQQLIPIAQGLGDDAAPLDATATVLERSGATIVVAAHRV